ncbi:MAG: FliM/FliN family flagellar motor switch protein [Planctomycetota bacterium]
MSDIRRVLKIEVPLVVRLAEKEMSVRDVLDLAPGSVIHFECHYDDPLELVANQTTIATGEAVKVNERFGLRLKTVCTTSDTVKALS